LQKALQKTRQRRSLSASRLLGKARMSHRSAGRSRRRGSTLAKRAVLAPLLLWAAATQQPYVAQPPTAEFVAPYVATTQEDVDTMLELAGVGPTDYLIDLGSGDGRIVITAAFRGAMGHGIELDRELVDLSRERAREGEVEDLVAFEQADIFQADLRLATVVTLYLMPEVNLRLRPRLLAQLQPGSRVVSNSFDMGEWRPDAHLPARSSGGVMMWVVPADVAGRWTITAGSERFELNVEQQFQEVEVGLARDGASHHVLQATLRGDRIAFVTGEGANRYAFSGRVEGARMSGVVQIHGQHESASRILGWQALRR
jgi:hypothetical protein